MKGTGMDNNYKIDKVYLNQVVDDLSKALVGKVMKRFELSSNLTDIKLQTKEIIYEEMRNLKLLLEAHQNGYDYRTWVFKSKKERE